MLEFIAANYLIIYVYLFGVVVFFIGYADELSFTDLMAAGLIATWWPVWVPGLLVKALRIRNWL